MAPGGRKLTVKEMFDYALNAGFKTPGDIETIVEIAMAESSSSTAPTGNPTHFGVLQFDAATAGEAGYTTADMLDPAKAFDAAYKTFAGHGGKRGRGFSPWETYTNGAYKKFAPEYAKAGGLKQVKVPITNYSFDPLGGAKSLLGGFAGKLTAVVPYVILIAGVLIVFVFLLYSLKGEAENTGASHGHSS